MVTFLENVQALAFLLIFISSVIYCRELKLKKWTRKLSKFEMSVYIIISIAIPIYLITYLILLVGK